MNLSVVPGGLLLLTAVARLVERHTWQLDLDNTTWLDVTWRLARQRTHELVPSSDLGAYVALAEGR